MDTKQRLTPEQLETEIRENLSGSDLKAFDMLCMKPTDEHITELLSRNEDLQAESPLREEDLRAQLLYEEGMRSPNAFVRDALRSSNQKDFGLSATLPEIDDILRLSDVEDLYEREKKTDALRWAWLEEKTLFSYFEAENVFAYWLQAQMLFRWDILNKEEGARIFRELIADMKRDIKFNKS